MIVCSSSATCRLKAGRCTGTSSVLEPELHKPLSAQALMFDHTAIMQAVVLLESLWQQEVDNPSIWRHKVSFGWSFKESSTRALQLPAEANTSSTKNIGKSVYECGSCVPKGPRKTACSTQAANSHFRLVHKDLCICPGTWLILCALQIAQASATCQSIWLNCK